MGSDDGVGEFDSACGVARSRWSPRELCHVWRQHSTEHLQLQLSSASAVLSLKPSRLASWCESWKLRLRLRLRLTGWRSRAERSWAVCPSPQLLPGQISDAEADTVDVIAAGTVDTPPHSCNMDTAAVHHPAGRRCCGRPSMHGSSDEDDSLILTVKERDRLQAASTLSTTTCEPFVHSALTHNRSDYSDCLSRPRAPVSAFASSPSSCSPPPLHFPRWPPR